VPVATVEQVFDGLQGGFQASIGGFEAGTDFCERHKEPGLLGLDGAQFCHLGFVTGQGVFLSVQHLAMPAHHEVRASDVIARRLHATLAAAAERGPRDFAALLLVPGVGARTIRALAMVAEVLHGAPCRFADPARFSLAHGGKDRHPYSVPLKVYDETIRVLKSAVQAAKLAREEELGALKRLDDQARALERFATGPSVAELIAQERERSHLYGGRSVFGRELARDITQRVLFDGETE